MTGPLQPWPGSSGLEAAGVEAVDEDPADTEEVGAVLELEWTTQLGADRVFAFTAPQVRSRLNNE